MEETKKYEEFMTLEEVAKYLGVHIKTIYRYLYDEKNPLPAFHLGFGGRVIRVNKEELDKWMKDFKNIK